MLTDLDFGNALNNDFDALAATHNGREISANERNALSRDFAALLEIAAWECMRALVIEVGVMTFEARDPVFYVDQFRWEGRDGVSPGQELPICPAEAVRNMNTSDANIFHVFSTSRDAMLFASLVHLTFYTQQAEECGGEIST